MKHRVILSEHTLRKIIKNTIHRILAESNISELQTYHGTGVRFDKFDHSFMGKGEGAQAYGWGTYVTTDLKTANHYATVAYDNGSGETTTCDGQPIPKDVFLSLQVAKDHTGSNDTTLIIKDLESTLQSLNRSLEIQHKRGVDSLTIDKLEQRIERCQAGIDYILSRNLRTIGKLSLTRSGKIIYRVEIPDDTGDNYIRWDNTPPQVIEYIMLHLPYLKAPQPDITPTFEELYEYNTHNNHIHPKQISIDLHKMGFVGIKMPTGYNSDNNRRGYNYVIFNEDDLHIIDRDELI